MKKFDLIIIITLIIISGVSFLAYKFYFSKSYENKYAEIYVKGNLYKTVSLEDKNYKEKINIKTDLGENIIEVKHGKIRILESDCHNQICVKEGYIENVGETIACLPHKLLIEIKSHKKSNIDEISY
ncbi:hypothetical protein CLOACE_15190 [Clostridium acetireducens DSM 10703]|jgi:hypothetical protein|uniref:Uncharacterized protein n=1 Tax=Clostridium acetireducens DSM 10703 TaxID=1121290 RepID=A0A1E8EYS6_9CLOT|nr:NusG domain II-containing protein [Clostridium acetireducens]OFI05824.1 hypothetical protein CLOACE_15190 [Clostridium acetireducens DSM 10703]